PARPGCPRSRCPAASPAPGFPSVFSSSGARSTKRRCCAPVTRTSGRRTGTRAIRRCSKGRQTMSDKIAPCLWFDGRAEEAARFYASLLPDSRVDAVHRAPADYPSGRKGDVLTVEFTLAGRKFVGLNGGPHFTFNEAVSVQI